MVAQHCSAALGRKLPAANDGHCATLSDVYVNVNSTATWAIGDLATTAASFKYTLA